MDILHAGILGIIEGFTEFLPISSTGHLIIAGKLLGLQGGEFEKSFDIIIQLGAILSVVVLYYKTFFANWDAFKKITVAFIPTAIIGLALYKIVKTYLLASAGLVVVTLFIGGIMIILFERWYKQANREGNVIVHNISELSYKQAAYIGLFQSIAIIPGVSRSAATILGGLFMGINRETIVEFSFLLAVPTMLAATGLDLVKNFSAFSADQTSYLAVGFVTSFVVALVGIKFLLSFVKKYSFTTFGVYRIVAAMVFFMFL
jgi:undecaprenyl-diphosphatase